MRPCRARQRGHGWETITGGENAHPWLMYVGFLKSVLLLLIFRMRREFRP